MIQSGKDCILVDVLTLMNEGLNDGSFLYLSLHN